MTTTQTAGQATPNTSVSLARAVRRKKKVEGRKKRALKLRSDKEFAKTYFEGRSKRAADKKTAFRKRKSRKK